MPDQMQAEIADLNTTIETLDDPREGYALVADRIKAYRRSGSAIPEDLRLIERRLMRECMAASQGR